MTPWCNRRNSGTAPVVYIVVDYRQQRRNYRPYRRYDSDHPKFSGTSSSSSSSDNKVLVFRTRLLEKHCLPSKIRHSESNIGWRRKNSKHRRPSHPMTRPTLLLPPMQYSDAYSMTPSSSAPVVISRVQRDNVATADGRNLQAPAEPSAPSPGHVLYNSEDHSDLAFLVGEEEWRFPAHSFVLSKMGNATFHALLNTAEASDVTRVKQIVLEDKQCVLQQSPLVLRLPNMQPDIFEQILRFIYTGQVSLSSVESTLRLIKPAQTFHLPELRSRCLAYISKHVSENNVLLVLKHLLAPAIQQQSSAARVADSTSPCQDGECHEEDNRQNELVFKCFLIVDHHADDVLNSEAFDTLDYEMLVEIVKRDTLDVSSESIVFDAVMRWACRACKRERKELTAENKSEVLGKALFLVRYLLMTHEEFLRGPVSQGVLQKDDKEALLARISGHSSATSETLPEHLKGWKLSVERRRQGQLTLTSPNSDCLSRVTEPSPSPSESVLAAHPVSTPTVSPTGKKGGERKKKSMSKKLLNGVGDLVICVIQLLD